MAMVKCKECGANVSTKGKACASCGAPPPKTSPLETFISTILILGLIVWLVTRSDDQSDTPSESRQKEIESHFSAWDGSHKSVTRAIKASMNDPGSYDHVETRYSEMGNYLVVHCKFRGKNAFGGVVLNAVQAKVDLSGNVLSLSE
jgi:hypothetical protein